MEAREVVVITGASAGVGRAVVREFARPGIQMGLLARGRAGLEAARQEVLAAGGQALAIPTDVADHQAVDAAAAQVEREFGPIDTWINDAMTTVFAPLSEVTPEEFKRATEVTYLGTVYGTMAALRSMLPHNRGTIVQVGSALAFRSIPLQAPYCGAKHAIVGFTDSLRSELLHRHSKIKLTMVHLPGMNTPQFDWCRTYLPRHPQPVPPIYQPEVAARTIHWAAHHPRRQFYVGTPTMISVFANQFAPGLLDWYLGRTGYSSQQTSQPVEPNRPNNLFQPLPGDRGAQGSFGNRALRHSPQAWMSEHRAWVGAALLLFGLPLLAAIRRRATARW